MLVDRLYCRTSCFHSSIGAERFGQFQRLFRELAVTSALAEPVVEVRLVRVP